MIKKILSIFFLVFMVAQVNSFSLADENQAAVEAMMVIGIQSRESIPDVKSMTLIKRKVNHRHFRCRDFPVMPLPGENPMPLLFIYDTAGEILFKTGFNYPTAKTVPPALPGTDSGSTPDVIFLQNPEVYLLVPYFKEAKFIEIYNPGESSAVTIKEIEQNDMDIYDESIPDPPPAQEGKLHFLIIASGFDASNMNTFTNKASELKSYLLSKEPFKTYGAGIEIHIYQNLESMGCYQGCNGIDRLMCCNTTRVMSAAAASGYLFDEIIVLHNTEVYSGGGYREYYDTYKTNSYSSYAMSYSGTSSKVVVLHELGHSFGNLCDEYSYSSEGYSYQSCVNCRDNCTIWRAISQACQQGCAAKSDYFRPADSIMLTLAIEHFNPVSLYATYLPDGLHERLQFFLNLTIPLEITLRAQRKEERARIIKRHYGEVDIILENLAGNPAEKFIVYRTDPEGNYEPIREIPLADFHSLRYSFMDKYLDKDVTYTYRVDALDPDGNIIQVSNEETI